MSLTIEGDGVGGKLDGGGGCSDPNLLQSGFSFSASARTFLSKPKSN